MIVCGVLVHAKPDYCDRVKAHLLCQPGFEVHAVTEEGKMVVTVEGDQSRSVADRIMQMQDIKGVLSVSLIYHHHEEDGVDAEEMIEFPTEAPTCSCEVLNPEEASS